VVEDAASIHPGDDQSFLRISGVLNFQTVPDLLETFCERAAEAKGDLTLDLSGITRIDSAGLSLLIEMMRRQRVMGYQVRLIHPPGQLYAMARFSQLDTFLGFEDTEPSSP